MKIDEQKQILKSVYGIELIESSEIKSGVSHMNYKVITDKGVFVLKRMNRNNKEEELIEELNYLKYMHDSQIPVILPIKTEEGYFVPYGDFIIALYPYVNHKTDQTTLENIGEVGKIVGKINKLPIIEKLKPRPNRRLIWKEFVDKCSDKELVSRFLSEYLPLHEKFSKMDLPITIIHEDIWNGNILFDDNNKVVCILDWESVDIYHRLFELSIVVVGSCYVNEKLDLDMFNEFLKTYSQKIELTELEKNIFYDYLCYIILWCVSWRYVMFNIRKIDERFYDFYIPMFKRYENLKSMGRDKFYEQVKF